MDIDAVVVVSSRKTLEEAHHLLKVVVLKVGIEVVEIKQGDTNDIAVSLTYNNQEVGVIDFDPIKETGASFENTALVIASIVCVLGAAALLTVAMKKKAYEN